MHRMLIATILAVGVCTPSPSDADGPGRFVDVPGSRLWVEIEGSGPPVVLTKSWRLWMTPVVIDAAGLKAIPAPVLVIAGDHDFTSIEETTELFRGLSKGRLMIVPGTGHGTFEDRPALMNLAVHDFLDAPPGK